MKYTLRSRRTAATLAANNSASVFDMQTHFGWKNAKTALEYIAKSKPQQQRMASMITVHEGGLENPVAGPSRAPTNTAAEVIPEHQRQSPKTGSRARQESESEDTEEVPCLSSGEEEEEEESNCQNQQADLNENVSQPCKKRKIGPQESSGVLSQVTNRSTFLNTGKKESQSDETKGNNFNFSNCQVSIVYNINKK